MKIFTVIIRVGYLNEGPNKLSKPWKLLNEILEFITTDPTAEQPKERAKRANVFLKLLIYVYLDISLTVWKRCVDSGLKENHCREALLRFHRTGTAEGIVHEFFGFHVLRFLKSGNIFSALKAYYTTITEKVNNFNLKGKILLVFDEIQEILFLCEGLFLSFESYTSCIPPEIPAIDDGKVESNTRGLFYALSCNMDLLGRDSNLHLSFFLTGTTFSMTHVEGDGMFKSTVRNGIKYMYPQIRLGYGDVKDILAEYFEFSESVLNDPTVLDLLKSFQGRPYIFFDGLFQRLFSTLISEPGVVESAPKFERFLQEAIENSGAWFTSRIAKLFNASLSSNRLIPNDFQTKNVRSLIPLLVMSLLCGDGTLTVTSADHLTAAVCTGIIPVGINPVDIQNITGQEIILHQVEPLVAEMVTRYLQQRIMDLTLEKGLSSHSHTI
jgi:hypothetical protein